MSGWLPDSFYSWVEIVMDNYNLAQVNMRFRVEDAS